MTAKCASGIVLLMCAMLGGARRASAQDIPARSRPLQLSAFGGASLVATGLPSATNLAFTGGADLGFLPHRLFLPAAEYRGSYAVSTGTIASEKSNLGGLKVTFPVRRLHPYVDVLYGRGEINYYGHGQQVPGKLIYYTQSASHVLSPGGGVELEMSRYLSLKLDVQLQRFATPVTASGYLNATSATVGVAYRFHLGDRGGKLAAQTF